MEEIKMVRVIVNGKFNAYEDLTGNNPNAIFVSQEDLDQIGKTKCFDLDNNCVVDYDSTIDDIIKKKNKLRARRQAICFPIINRGQLWYETLSDAQKKELKVWYKAWLDVTETLTEPVKPKWLK